MLVFIYGLLGSNISEMFRCLHYPPFLQPPQPNHPPPPPPPAPPPHLPGHPPTGIIDPGVVDQLDVATNLRTVSHSFTPLATSVFKRLLIQVIISVLVQVQVRFAGSCSTTKDLSLLFWMKEDGSINIHSLLVVIILIVADIQLNIFSSHLSSVILTLYVVTHEVAVGDGFTSSTVHSRVLSGNESKTIRAFSHILTLTTSS
jgi:hypothetical protein